MGALGELRSGVVHVCVCAKQLLVRANVRQAATDHVHVCNQAACLGLPEPCIYGVYTVLWAGELPFIRSYTVYIYGSGQPYACYMTVYTPAAHLK